MTRLLTVTQFSRKLGIKPSTARSWVWKRRIEFIKIGRCVRIHPSEISRLLRQGTVALTRSNDPTSKH